MKKGIVNKLSIIMAIIMVFMAFYAMGMPNSFICRNHYYEAECPEAFGVKPHHNLVVDDEGNVIVDEDEEYQARQKEIALEQQRVKEKVDPMYDQMLSRIPVWFLFMTEYSDFCFRVGNGLFAAAILCVISMVLYRKKPALLLAICCVAIPVLACLANYIANHPSFCK